MTVVLLKLSLVGPKEVSLATVVWVQLQQLAVPVTCHKECIRRIREYLTEKNSMTSSRATNTSCPLTTCIL